jgi:hypothetical protein
MVYADDIIIFELNERTSETKFHRIVTICRDFVLNITLDKYMAMKTSQTEGGTKKTKWKH